MIKRFVKHPIFFLIIALFGLCIFPKKATDALRIWIISSLSPSSKGRQHSEEARLQIENQLLSQQLESVIHWIGAESQLEKEWKDFKECSDSEDVFFVRRKKCLAQLIDRRLHSIPARVIFREYAPLSTTLWINVGERDNHILGKEVVAENSPVIVGKCVVGVIDKVTHTKSRVCLLTDPLLSIPVRVVRGGEQLNLLVELLSQVSDILQGTENDEAFKFSNAVSQFTKNLEGDAHTLYLAKGSVNGSKIPKSSGGGQILQGIGFNYDFPDDEGEARILRTGETLSGSHRSPLIQKGDLLVTSGLDGIFPPDLHVAVVTKILPLHEGGTSYSLEAKPLAVDLNGLSEVFVLPPSS